MNDFDAVDSSCGTWRIKGRGVETECVVLVGCVLRLETLMSDTLASVTGSICEFMVFWDVV